MKKTLVLLLSCFGCLLINAQKIYVTNMTALADAKVCIVDMPNLADLIVYKASSSIESGVNNNEGKWYFTDNELEADKKITFVQMPANADLKIYYTKASAQAGWQNRNKKYLLEIK